MYDIHPDKGIINGGKIGKIKKVMEKAKKGEDISVAFLGGSITQGCLSSSPDTCYAALVYKWWVTKFPDCKIKYINAGIGGTSSQFGVSRVRQHVLSKTPDFLLTEFAVNDTNDAFFEETYEGLIRTILKSENAPALMLMNNVFYDTGLSAEEMHLKVAKHYDLPMVSMKTTIYPEVENGNIKASDITPDCLHPNDTGHELVASVIINLLEKIYAFEEDECEEAYELPEPITPNRYENSVRMKNYNSSGGAFTVELNGFSADTHKKSEYLDIFSGGYTASKENDEITFVTECTGLAVQYKKTINKPAPIAIAIIDDDNEHPYVLDANFEETWGDSLHIDTVLAGAQQREHKITIRIIKTHEDDKVPFYLVSVIASK